MLENHFKVDSQNMERPGGSETTGLVRISVPRPAPETALLSCALTWLNNLNTNWRMQRNGCVSLVGALFRVISRK